MSASEKTVVYIVMRTEGDEWSAGVVGVYSTEKAADEKCAQMNSSSYGWHYVTDHTIDQ